MALSVLGEMYHRIRVAVNRLGRIRKDPLRNRYVCTFALWIRGYRS